MLYFLQIVHLIVLKPFLSINALNYLKSGLKKTLHAHNYNIHPNKRLV